MLVKKQLAIIIFVLCLSFLGASASIGAAPGSFDLEDVEPGTTVEKQIYVNTNFEDEFRLNPSVSTGPTTSSFSSENSSDISEADIDDWITLEDNVIIRPNETDTYELSDGSTINANGFFSVEINVPQDAEPGLYFGRIRLNPEIIAEGGGGGTVNWGETRPTFSLRIPGQAERSITVQDVNGVRIGEDRVQIIKQLQNTGTVTTRLDDGEITVLNDEGRELDNLNINSATLAPGEVAEIDTTWSSDEVQGGNYQIEGLGDYRTGETHISGDFAITDVIRDPVEVDGPEAEQDDEAFDMPFTLVIMLLLGLGVFLYFLDIDLVWIIAITGFVSISAFIFFSAAGNYLILILVGLLGVTLYYGA